MKKIIKVEALKFEHRYELVNAINELCKTRNVIGVSYAIEHHPRNADFYSSGSTTYYCALVSIGE